MRYFVDTPVILHAVGMPGPEQETCRQFLRELDAGRFELVTSTEVVQEVLFVLNRRERGDAALELTMLLDVVFESPLKVNHTDITRACEIMAELPRLTSRDAIHLATAQRFHVDAIVTVDEHLLAITEFPVLSPSQIV